MRAVKPVRESKIEKQIRDYAEATGWFQCKIMKASKNGMMDRVFIRNGVVIWGEVKRPNGEESTIQDKRRREMMDHGALCFVWDNYDDAKKTLNSY